MLNSSSNIGIDVIDYRMDKRNLTHVTHSHASVHRNGSNTRAKVKSKIFVFTKAQKRYLFFKRAIDIIFSSMGLLFCSPFFLLLALLIKLDSRGPVIFKQERVGRNSKPFTCYKFRTMYVTAPSSVATSELTDSGDYITRIGRVIRHASIDELPQLFNVLKGEMSIIGPRPLIIAEEDAHLLRRKSCVYMLKPGVTGLAQTKGRDLVDTPEKVELDRQYLEELSFVNDFKLFFSTIRVIVKHEGIAEGGEDIREDEDVVLKKKDKKHCA